MFGYVICYKDDLSEEENERYRRIYCGVCHALKNQYGQLERWTLNYDTTFLALILSALYEPEEKEIKYRCSAHPFEKRVRIENPYIKYAADMTIILAYYKCLDDWNDEKKLTSHIFGHFLKKDFMMVKEKYPRQCQAVADSIHRLTELEKDETAAIDDVMDYAGKMLQELYVYKEDFWADSMRKFGYALGRFIYLMDAVMDYDEDQKKGNFNPLKLIDRFPGEMETFLMMEISEAADLFERLPIIQDEHLLHNILYGGVWLKYKAKFQKKDSEMKKDQK